MPILNHWHILWPPMCLLVSLCATLLFTLWSDRPVRLAFWITQAGVLAALICVGFTYDWPVQSTMAGALQMDHLSTVVNAFVLVVALAYLWLSAARIFNDKIPVPEFLVLWQASLLGILLLVSAHQLLMLYLGLELMTLPIYAQVALRRDCRLSGEAAMKYFVMGALASGFLLYGMSLVFGATGSIDFSHIQHAVMQMSTQSSALLLLGLIFMVAGIAFKLGLAPFHSWVPDVYAGANSMVSLFIATLPKIAAFVLLYRICVQVLPIHWHVAALPYLSFAWQDLLIGLAILSIIWGNVAALVQFNLRRLLGYSSVAHMGYMLLGLVAGTMAGYRAALFYALSYLLMTLAAFGVLVVLNRDANVDTLEDITGLAKRQPLCAFVLLLVMFSMAGIPPLLGFMAKLSVLEALVSVHLSWLAVLAVVFAVIGSFYYLRVIQAMYFQQPLAGDAFVMGAGARVVLVLNAAFVLLLGLLPGVLFSLCHYALMS